MDLWTIILAVIGLAVFAIYLFDTRRHNYFAKLGIPFVKPRSMFEEITAMIYKVKPISDSVDEIYKSYPDAKYLGYYLFSTPIIVLRDPELIKSVAIKNFDSFPNHKMFVESPTEPMFRKNLFTLKDDAWRNMRSLLSPAFTSSKMKIMFKTMSECAVNFVDRLTKQDPKPEELNIKDTFRRYTLDVIGSSAFGLSVNSAADSDDDFSILGKAVTDLSGLKVTKLFFIKNFPWIARLFNLRLLDSKTTDFFINAIGKTIATRDAQGIVRPDMIDLMMQARDGKKKSALSPEDMAAQAFIFFLGGFESPAITMSFAAHLLALNPEVQRKLQAEIDQVNDGSCGKLSYEDLHAMKYLDTVVSETLRMFPPSLILDRVVAKSFTLPPALPGLEPVTIEPGQNVWLPCYSLQHDAQYYPDPEKFYPERFSDENKSGINPMTYLPFGIGPRGCIAYRFALMEVKLVLFHLLARCDLKPTSNAQSVIKLSSKSFDMMPEGGFNLKVEPRT